MYGVGGERTLSEATLDHLSGYDGARPVCIGNAALASASTTCGVPWSPRLTRTPVVTAASRIVCGGLCKLRWSALEHWREPDQGIWEVRSSPQHFTFSKVACWIAADAGARIAYRRGEDSLAARWRAAAEEIRDDVLANAVDERGAFTQHYATKALDASVLLISRLGFLPASDDRVRNTVHAIAEER